MNIAYIILAHKNIAQLRLLMETLQNKDDSIFLHLDKLAGEEIFHDAKQALIDIYNLHFLPRNPTPWGGFGLVKASLTGIHEVIKNPEIDYALLMSGQDYPIKPINSFKKVLKENNGKSFLEAFPFPHPYWKDRGGFDRIERWHFSLPMKRNRITRRIRVTLNWLMDHLQPNRALPLGYHPFGGSQWWCLHRSCLGYINTFCRENPGFVRFFKTVRIPDELIFHTILMNSQLKSTIINQKLTYVDWESSPGPKVLDGDDLQNLMTSAEFFARKFDIDKSKNIIYELNKKWGRC